MDRLIPGSEAARDLAGGAAVFVALPDLAPMDMPVQSLASAPKVQPLLTRRSRLLVRRIWVIGGAALLTVFGAHEMYLVLNVGGLTLLEYLFLCLFVVLFGWIAFSFTNAVSGVLAMLRRPDDGLGIDASAPLPKLRARTAILMPTYNEEPARIFAGLQATYESVRDTGAADAFDFFILSDTTDADIWIAEEAAFLTLRDRLDDPDRLFYRRRPRNTDRKAGNVAEWVTRFGGAYDHMLVLDADSVMTGDCIVRLAAAMENSPHTGLIQTLPVIVGGRTVFARMQQFAGRLYGPLIAYGLASWHGPDSNYWGHNAIIRTRAFAESAGLPHLKGRKPFGGHILSHDFVEAALIRRAGWGVHMVPWLEGSYEEGPPSLTDLAVRDRRWCQGNLQHAAVLPTRGLHPLSRLHMLVGIGSYITAPLWLIMLLAGLLTALQARFIPPDYFPSEFSLFPHWPAQDPVRAAWVFGGTMAILLLPKLMAYVLLLRRRAYHGFGGMFRTLGGVFVETLLAGLLAPVTMLSQSAAVTSILMGRDGGWNPQRRDDGSLSLRDTLLGFMPHTLVGILLGSAAAAISWPLLLWMSPVVAGLLLAVPLVLWTSGVRRVLSGLLTTPETRDPPAVLMRAQELARHTTEGVGEAVHQLAGDPRLLNAHRGMLPDGGERLSGDYGPDRLVARAKIADARDLPCALRALTSKEKAAALADASALDQLLQLRRHEATSLPEGASP